MAILKTFRFRSRDVYVTRVLGSEKRHVKI